MFDIVLENRTFGAHKQMTTDPLKYTAASFVDLFR
jgi:hypothetical protein